MRRTGAPGAGKAGGHARTDDAPRGRRTSGRRRATLGSTSYDEAEEAFEPDWSGATWYGPASGTYWTINPKEYADPRKHGPEYQARARRRAAATPGTTPDPAASAGSGPEAAPDADAMSEAGTAAGPDSAEPPQPPEAGHDEAGRGQHSSTPAGGIPPAWRARTWTAASQPGTGRAAFEHEPMPDERTAGGPPQPGDRSGDGPAPSRAPEVARYAARPARAPGIVARVALAVAGWLVPGFALGALAGFPGGIAATLPLQAAGIVALVLVPRAAWAAAGGGLALVLAAVPIVAVVAALGGPFVPGGPASEAAVVLAAIAWAFGAFLVGAGRVAPYPWPAET